MILHTRLGQAIVSQKQKGFCNKKGSLEAQLHRRKGLQIPHYPAQSIYQRPGQAIFSKSRPNGRFIKASCNCSFIKADAIKSFWPSHFQQKQAQWPFYQGQPQWPFYQGRSSQVARPSDLSRGLQSRYYPAQSVYQRPGQAILSKGRPNGRFIKASSNCRFIKTAATDTRKGNLAKNGSKSERSSHLATSG